MTDTVTDAVVRLLLHLLPDAVLAQIHYALCTTPNCRCCCCPVCGSRACWDRITQTCRAPEHPADRYRLERL